MNGSIMEVKVCNTRDNCADSIWFHIKQNITKELSKGIFCIFWDNLCEIILSLYSS